MRGNTRENTRYALHTHISLIVRTCHQLSPAFIVFTERFEQRNGHSIPQVAEDLPPVLRSET